MRALVAALVAVVALACRGPAADAGKRDPLALLVDTLAPRVEAAAGLRFKQPPRSAMRTREEVRRYILRQLDREVPPPKMRGLTTAYRLFGLIPDTVDLRALLLDLYAEQVAGYYDPDSSMLFGVAGANPGELRVVVAHELVHALQGQYLRLDSILRTPADNDRLVASQAILEGQATVVSIEVLAPGREVVSTPEFWEMYREQVRGAQQRMPVFAKAPLVLQEALIFPYLEGAEFMGWWDRSVHRDTVPYGPRMPVSTEQILHPERYERGDVPVPLTFPPEDGVLYEDNLGESEIRVLAATLTGRTEVPDGAPLGWGGDRYRVYETPAGPALVWYAAWDDARARDRFVAGPGAALARTTRPNYRSTLDTLSVGGRPGFRYVLAPEGWGDGRAGGPAGGRAARSGI